MQWLPSQSSPRHWRWPLPEAGCCPSRLLCSQVSLLWAYLPPRCRRHHGSLHTLQKFLFCRSGFHFFDILPPFSVMCKIVLYLKECSCSVWLPSPWALRVWVTHWSGKGGFSETNPSLPAIARGHPLSRHYSMATIACPQLVIFNEPLPTRTSHFSCSPYNHVLFNRNCF